MDRVKGESLLTPICKKDVTGRDRSKTCEMLWRLCLGDEFQLEVLEILLKLKDLCTQESTYIDLPCNIIWNALF